MDLYDLKVCKNVFMFFFIPFLLILFCYCSFFFLEILLERYHTSWVEPLCLRSILIFSDALDFFFF